MLLTPHANTKLYIPDRCEFVIGAQAIVCSDIRLSEDRHFYSIRESEKQKSVDKVAQVWTFEGVAWYAFD